MAYIFDASKGESPESVAYKRQIAARLMGGIGNRGANSVGEGIGNALASLGAGFSARSWNKNADTAEQTGRAGASARQEAIRNALMTGQTPDPSALMDLAADPWAGSGAQSIANTYLGQHIKQNDPSHKLDMQYRQAQIDKLRSDAANPGGDESFFGNPVAIQNADGTISYGQMGNKGTFRPIQLPEGQSFAPPTKKIDAGTEELLVDQSGNVVARIPKNIEGAKAAEVVGKDLGESKALLESMNSKMPGLQQVVTNLSDLAGKATYTMAGQALDAGRRQAGMEPRESAVARAEYTAIVDNQILPLLRDTFGAQFTAAEGERLGRTLGDPDKSPAEKQALLTAFIEQKKRDIEALSARTGQAAPASPPGGKRLKFNPATGDFE